MDEIDQKHRLQWYLGGLGRVFLLMESFFGK
jgi:hypothetical protein